MFRSSDDITKSEEMGNDIPASFRDAREVVSPQKPSKFDLSVSWDNLSDKDEDNAPPKEKLQASVRRSVRNAGDAALVEELEKWSYLRLQIGALVSTPDFEKIMGCVVLINLVLIIIETDSRAECYPEYADTPEDCPQYNLSSFHAANIAMLVLYTIEAGLRLFALRKMFFHSPWNVLDAVILVSGYIGEVFQGVATFAFLKVFRILRLTRALRVYIVFRELYLMVNGLLGAFKAIGWGCLLLMMFLTVWSIVMVEFVHPINSQLAYPLECVNCNQKYATVFRTDVTLFQTIITGDSWGETAIPLIEKKPAFAALFASIVITVSLGLMNLILAVIVQRAAEAHDADVRQRVHEKLKDKVKQGEILMDVCRQMDEDGDGTISVGEFMGAFNADVRFRNLLQVMDIEKGELESVFRILDTDKSGSVDYNEFCEQLYKIQNRDPKTMITFMKLNLFEVQLKLETLVDVRIREQEEQLRLINEKLANVLPIPLRPSGEAPHEKTTPVSFSVPCEDELSPPQWECLLETKAQTKDDFSRDLGAALERTKVQLWDRLRVDLELTLDQWASTLKTELRRDTDCNGVTHDVSKSNYTNNIISSMVKDSDQTLPSGACVGIEDQLVSSALSKPRPGLISPVMIPADLGVALPFDAKHQAVSAPGAPSLQNSPSPRQVPDSTFGSKHLRQVPVPTDRANCGMQTMSHLACCAPASLTLGRSNYSDPALKRDVAPQTPTSMPLREARGVLSSGSAQLVQEKFSTDLMS